MSTNLNCSSARLRACYEPIQGSYDQKVSLSLTAKDAVGATVIPEEYWEIVWSAQIEEDGVSKAKYFGGLESSMEFSYAHATGTYNLTQSANLWYFPQPSDELCHVQAGSGSYTYADFMSARINPGAVQNGSATDTMDYLHTHWYVSDAASREGLVAYGQSWCVAAGGGEYLEDSTLPDGSYVFRSTGAYDTAAGGYSWTFCGQSGGAEQELQFRMVGGVCHADILATKDNICVGATDFTITQELECMSAVEAVIPVQTLTAFDNANTTCLYVNLMDQFGDGWDSNSVFSYWVEVEGFDSNVESVSLNCSCPQRVGCISQPLPHDQLVYFSLTTFDANGTNIVPQNYWEMMYTVQIVENGVFNEKYYAGHGSSLVFLYTQADESYELSYQENLWAYPDSCDTECVRTFNNSTDFIPFDSYMSTVRHSGPGSPHGSSEIGTADYLQSVWYVTDAATETNLYAYGKTWCNESFSADAECNSCLQNGSYIFRSTGAFDAVGSEFVWDYCGVIGGVQDQLRFDVIDGVCTPVAYKSVSNVCEGSDSTFPPTPVPTLTPTVTPTTTPSSLPTLVPTMTGVTNTPSLIPSASPTMISTSEPSGEPSFAPSSHPSIATVTYTCTPYDRAICNNRGTCAATGDGCNCDDVSHYWSSDYCSTWHSNRELVDPNDWCYPDETDGYCSYLGVCSSDGQFCNCVEQPHRYSHERCAIYHADASASPSAVPLTSGGPSPAPVQSTGPTRAPVFSVAPTLVPTATPTSLPTEVPTQTPTASPSSVPTASPTALPTASPTALPTAAPSSVPTASPTALPTASPS
jgi:hypothetical protein